jgi:hypothetical protein
MKIAKQIRKQAKAAERAAMETADSLVAAQMKSLALAVRAQADVMKRKKKSKKSELIVESARSNEIRRGGGFRRQGVRRRMHGAVRRNLTNDRSVFIDKRY